MLHLRLLLLFVAIASSTGDDDALTKAYKEMGIIPNIMDSPPDGYLKIVYGDNVVVDNGNEIKPSQTKEPPYIEWTGTLGSFYTLVLTCIDAPNRQNPYLREWIHWLVVNVPATDVDLGDTIGPHIPLLAPKGMGPSRYLYYVFQQPAFMIFEEPHLNNTSTEGHAHFDTMKFAEKYALGRPIASATVQVQWDNYVPVMYKQLQVGEE